MTPADVCILFGSITNHAPMDPMTLHHTPSNFRDDPDRLMNEREAAALLGYTIRCLQNWRLRGGGPPFVKVSQRSVRYRRRDVLAWIEGNLRTSTSDPGPAGSEQ